MPTVHVFGAGRASPAPSSPPHRRHPALRPRASSPPAATRGRRWWTWRPSTGSRSVLEPPTVASAAPGDLRGASATRTPSRPPRVRAGRPGGARARRVGRPPAARRRPLPVGVRLRAPAARPARRGGLRAAGASTATASRRRDSSPTRGASRRRRSWRCCPWRVTWTTWSSTPRAASAAPAARRPRRSTTRAPPTT